MTVPQAAPQPTPATPATDEKDDSDHTSMPPAKKRKANTTAKVASAKKTASKGKKKEKAAPQNKKQQDSQSTAPPAANNQRHPTSTPPPADVPQPSGTWSENLTLGKRTVEEDGDFATVQAIEYGVCRYLGCLPLWLMMPDDAKEYFENNYKQFVTTFQVEPGLLRMLNEVFAMPVHLVAPENSGHGTPHAQTGRGADWEQQKDLFNTVTKADKGALAWPDMGP
ncbi:unnamed protein product [Zymoseptoria tritici ST99CH_1A5]|uniref:Uncharacterized protein n=1 Tax=Zymoseptoria tritici ST99CH_1A5 TaxID=1276529 RepID=A0A1Y6LLD0_ZYMTR|nr:unnamed protein product [Zymoseptoria tritici ST99CH_1A5]